MPPKRPVGQRRSAARDHIICVPMLKENELIGTISIYRQEVRPFTEKQIKLLTNFAAQAVIAIENTRLLSELREIARAADRDLRSAQVISSSPGELEPVFQAMLENAVRICEAGYGTLYSLRGRAHRTARPASASRRIGRVPEQRGPYRPERGEGLLGRVFHTQESPHADYAAEPDPGPRG